MNNSWTMMILKNFSKKLKKAFKKKLEGEKPLISKSPLRSKKWRRGITSKLKWASKEEGTRQESCHLIAACQRSKITLERKLRELS